MNLPRLIKAFAKEGLAVRNEGGLWFVRRLDAPAGTPEAKVLLPEGFPVEGRALAQLAALAAVQHPLRNHVASRVYASPDFHPGDGGIAIGSVIETGQEMIVPSSIGDDINCGMRLHVTDLTVDRLLLKKAELVELLKGDLLGGTRDVYMTAPAMRTVFVDGISYVNDVRAGTSLERSDKDELVRDSGRIYENARTLGVGALEAVPESLTQFDGIMRDPYLATAGSGNHFVEVQVVSEVFDKSNAYHWSGGELREGRVAFMIHSGSRMVGKYVGSRWRDRAKEKWPSGMPHPDLYPIVEPEDISAYHKAESAASNYGFFNRLLLAEIVRRRVRQVFGPSVRAPLVSDMPHNITVSRLPQNYSQDDDTTWGKYRFIARKGACPAEEGTAVVIPGSMGTSSYLMRGLGNEDFLRTASHGAGRAQARVAMHRGKKEELPFECYTLREERRIEEAPSAYKDIVPVVDVQVKHGIVDYVAEMKPLFTFKC